MLSNFQLGGQALLQIFLLGQPEFRDLLAAPELEQLRQRVIATHHLEPMLASEVEPYIRHRLSLVGWQDNPHFTGDAFAAIYAATDGVPRRINALMSRVMLLGAVDHLAEIDASAVEAVAADMGLGEHGVEEVAPATEPQHINSAMEPSDDPLPVVEAIEANLATEELELHRIREELDTLRSTLSLNGDRANLQRLIGERLDGIEARVNSLEARSDEQEVALRKVLNLLVDWVENENAGVRAA